MSSFRNAIHKAEENITHIKFKVKEALNLFDPVIIYPYSGYGNGEKAFINGRILEKERFIHDDHEREHSFWHNLHKIWKRYESDEIPGVEIEGELKGVKAKAVSNDEGYFTLVFEGLSEKQLSDGWHQANLRISNMPFDLEYEEEFDDAVLINNQQDCFGIISDVDDTIIKSEAMNALKKLQIMISENAESRVAFDGVEKMYCELIQNWKNPLFFISGSSYNLHDMLVSFCEHQNIPKGPFLLRNLGLTAEKWLKQDTSEYKKAHIEHIMQVFNRLSFICIGDSGQKDPEIYSEIYKKYPKQVKAIYIRQVHSQERKKELKQMADEMDVPFVVMDTSEDALAHARSMGWIPG